MPLLNAYRLGQYGISRKAYENSYNVGLIAHYLLDGNANDESGYINGTASNVSYTSDSPSGVRQCAVFNGNNSKIDINKVASLFDGYNPWAVCMWIKPSSSAISWPTFFHSNVSLTNYANRGISLNFGTPSSNANNVENSRLLSGTGLATGYDSTDCIDGNWHFIYTDYDGTALRICTDDRDKLSATGTNNSISKQTVCRIGAAAQSSGSELWYKGEMSDVRIYTRKLNDIEISDLYNYGRGM